MFPFSIQLSRQWKRKGNKSNVLDALTPFSISISSVTLRHFSILRSYLVHVHNAPA